MNRNRSILTLIVCLALVGIVTAVYDFWARSQGIPLWCPFAGTGCDTVQSSPYAVILGIPLSFLGILGFGAYVVLASVAWFPKGTVGKLSTEATYFCVYILAALNLVEVCSMLYFGYLQVAVIHAICSLCVFSAALNVAIGGSIATALITRKDHSQRAAA